MGRVDISQNRKKKKKKKKNKKKTKKEKMAISEPSHTTYAEQEAKLKLRCK